MEHLKEILLNEIEEYREQGKRFLNKELTVPQFKKISGGMGSYAQRGASDFMVRLRIMSGVTNRDELSTISSWAKEYNLDTILLTTRQAIQFHNITIDQVCELMKRGIEKEIYTRGAGGNFPRNVALSPLAGVHKDEAFDVTPYALEVNKYFLNQITTYKLPRKLKVAFSATAKDEAHCTVSDLGFIARVNNGEKYFEVYAGGGLGRNPQKGVVVSKKVSKEDILYYVEAMVSMFKAEGDWENHNKARVRYMLARMGEEEFINCYNKHLKEVKENNELSINIEEKVINKAGKATDIKNIRLIEQKQEGLYSVYFQPIGGILKISDLDEILEATKDMEFIEFRTSMEKGMYIRNLNGDEAEKLLAVTMHKGGDTLAEQSVSCIGATTCQIGILDSNGLLHKIVAKLKENKVEEGLLPRIYISGCPNSCGVHEIGSIGLAGKKKRVNNETRNAFELSIGGHVSLGNTELGKVIADIAEENVIDMILEISRAVKAKDMTFKTWILLNEDEFKEIVKKYSI
ncbi:nitrite/sulfite reductase [Clostridium massiliamazoniense]|uniref:nitrite/sulfite reductase n=1 Tax=Clostridium massiliamazoniense TaxID=1347366 RepID=UPI0006D7A287|nr:nitrite/sulfite reductase [Clostridium massiliamazoniense]